LVVVALFTIIFLDYRQKEYGKGKKVTYAITQSELTKLKKLEEYGWLKEVGSQSLQMAIRQLEYKTLWKGKTLLKIDEWFPSSQICSNYGTLTGKKSLNIRNYGLGQVDNRNTVGTIGIQACGVSSVGT
jgi:transposase